MISSELLRRYPYFADVDEQALREVAMIAEQKVVPGGTTLFTEGEKADHLYILEDGEVDLKYTLGDGSLRTVDTLVAGDLMMWSALVAPYRCTAVGQTRKECTLIGINGVKLRELCEKDHNLGYRMLVCLTQLLASRLEGARVQLATAD